MVEFWASTGREYAKRNKKNGRQAGEGGLLEQKDTKTQYQK